MNKLIILGSGPAGLTAAIYAARAELNPILIAGKTPGGQLMWTTEVENFPGFPDGIMGPDLMQNMLKQAKKFGATVVNDDATKVDFSKPPYRVSTSKQDYETQSVIIATGAEAKWLGLESEEKFKGKGVTACATCDGPFFKNKKVFVVGGGDAAAEEALFLTKYASAVIVLIRSDQMKASVIMQERIKNNPKISIKWNTGVQEVLGEEKMTGLRVINTQNQETETMEGEGLFVAIGHKPKTDIFSKFLPTQKDYIVTKNGVITDIEGIFVAGDVTDYRYRQAVTAAGSGCKAAIEAEKYLTE